MKKWIFLFVLGISLSGHAQLPVKLKYDQLIYSYDSATVLVLKGNSAGIYDLSEGNLLLAPTKNHLINFPHTNMYAEIPVKAGDISIHWFNRDSQITVKGSDSICYIGFDQPEFANGIVDLNGYEYNVETDDFTGNMTDHEKTWSQAKIEKVRDNIYLIQSYRSRSTDVLFDEKNADRVVYNMSGIYDFDAGKWLVEPSYKEFFCAGNYFFCLKENTTFVPDLNEAELYQPEISCSYDVFKLDADNLIQLVYESITKLNNELITDILGTGFATPYSEDGIHYVYAVGNKFGFVKFQLFEDPEEYFPDFAFQKILPAEFDFIAYSDVYEKLITWKNASAGEMAIYHVFVNDEADSISFLTTGNFYINYYDFDPLSYWDKYILTSTDFKRFHADINGDFGLHDDERNRPTMQPHFGLKIMNDSLVMVHNYQYAVESPYPYLNQWGEDSVILAENGDFYSVYPNLYDGFGKSGVFNLNTGEWIIEPDKVLITGGQSGYLIKSATLSDDKTPSWIYSYSVWNMSGDEVRLNLEEEDFLNELDLYKYAYSGLAADTVFEAPCGYYRHTQTKEDNRFFYLSGNGQMGIYFPDENYHNQWTDNTFEFVHYNPTEDFYFYLEGDSVFFKQEDFVRSVSRTNGKISVVQTFSQSGYAIRVLTIVNGDTTAFGESVTDYYSATIASIEITGDLMIINDHTTLVDMSCVECFDADGLMIDYKLIYESENSSVWKKTEEGWQKISPYYATIESILNQRFIASSGFYEFESYDFFHTQPQKPDIKIEKRYFILDSTMHAIQYLDYFDFAYIEDLGFGLKMQLNKNEQFFFMTYDGIAITDAEWDRFELENGKLKAILDTKYEVDEYGDIILNEFGMPNEIVSQTVRYYKLP